MAVPADLLAGLSTELEILPANACPVFKEEVKPLAASDAEVSAAVAENVGASCDFSAVLAGKVSPYADAASVDWDYLKLGEVAGNAHGGGRALKD